MNKDHVFKIKDAIFKYIYVLIKCNNIFTNTSYIVNSNNNKEKNKLMQQNFLIYMINVPICKIIVIII